MWAFLSVGLLDQALEWTVGQTGWDYAQHLGQEMAALNLLVELHVPTLRWGGASAGLILRWLLCTRNQQWLTRWSNGRSWVHSPEWRQFWVENELKKGKWICRWCKTKLFSRKNKQTLQANAEQSAPEKQVSSPSISVIHT